MLKMSTVSHNTSKETETPLTSNCKVQQQSTGPAFLSSTNSLCFSFLRLVTRVRSHAPAALAVHSNLPDSNSVNSAARGLVGGMEFGVSHYSNAIVLRPGARLSSAENDIFK